MKVYLKLDTNSHNQEFIDSLKLIALINTLSILRNCLLTRLLKPSDFTITPRSQIVRMKHLRCWNQFFQFSQELAREVVNQGTKSLQKLLILFSRRLLQSCPFMKFRKNIQQAMKNR